MAYDSDYEVRLATLEKLGGDVTKKYDSVYEIDLAILEATGGGGSGTTYSAGTGISIDENNAISIDPTVVQEKLTAGTGISISGETISCTVTDTTYSAGTGITIDAQNQISVAAGYVKAVSLTQAQYDALVAGGTVDASTLYIITDAQ